MSESPGPLLRNDDSDKAVILAATVDEFGDGHEQTQQTVALDEIVKKIEQLLQEMEEDHTSRLTCLNTQKLRYCYEQTRHVKDLEEAIEMAEVAVNAIPKGHIDYAECLDRLGMMLEIRFEWTGNIEDLEQAIRFQEQAARMTPAPDLNRGIRLYHLANMLESLYEWRGNGKDLDEAIRVAKLAALCLPQHLPEQALCLNNLGNMLEYRFEQVGRVEDLEEAIQMSKQAVHSIPEDHMDRAACLNNLGKKLERRYERSKDPEDLEICIQIAKQVVDSTPPHHPHRATFLYNLAFKLGRRFVLTGEVQDITVATRLVGLAQSSYSDKFLHWAAYLNNLGDELGRRYERTGSLDDLSKTIELAELAVESTPSNHPDRAAYLNNLGVWLGRRSERVGRMDDLGYAIDIITKAVETTPTDYNRASMLHTLGTLLGRLFERTGSRAHLDRAIEVTESAVEEIPIGADRASVLNTLGTLHGRRYGWTGAMDDLKHAIEVTDMAINATPTKHHIQAGWLNNLSIWLGIGFKRTGATKYLNRAIEVAERAVEATPQDHPDQANRLNNLANQLGRRYKQSGSSDDLSSAIRIAELAVDHTPIDHPNRANMLNTLGTLLDRRSERTESMNDLNRAVEVAKMAVEATPKDHFDRACLLNNLGCWLGKLFKRTGSMEYLEHALSCFKEGWACLSSPPSVRIHLARRAATILASQLDWEESSHLLQGAVKLLPIVSPWLLESVDKQHMLGQFSGVASMAAAISLNAGKNEHQALEILELGRCIIAGFLLDMRTDVSDLKERLPGLASEFETLRDELDSTPSGTATLGDTKTSWKSQANRRFEADQKFNEVITKIRDQPGFQNFLLPPTDNELMAAAEQGSIVIINVSSYRCDAFLVEHHQIRVLPLPDLKEEELYERVRQQLVGSISTLEWLWSVVTEPILDALGYHHTPSDDNWSRVWWIPTGVLSRFPIHAAGLRTKGSNKRVLDRVMSSYSSSIKALVYGRRYSVHRAAESALEQALLVPMQDTPKGVTLPYACKEVEMVAQLCRSLRLNPVIPPRRRKEVLAHLGTCKIFHFAGHGHSDPLDPSRSCLLLEDCIDSPLTVGDIRSCRIQESAPFLAYLSACSTSVNTGNRLVDEGIHLASASQLAGFRHVIGTLWEVSDSHCVDVARIVYETILNEGMTDMAVCRGLHRAIKELRDRCEAPTNGVTIGGRDLKLSNKSSLQHSPYWVPYVHFGV